MLTRPPQADYLSSMPVSPVIRRTVVLTMFCTAAAAAQQTEFLAPLKVVDPSFINRSANACVDFFQFANGSWLKRDTIPAAYGTSGVGRDMLDRNQLVVRSVLEDAVSRRASLPAHSAIRKLGTFYATCMDSSAAERAGIDPLRPSLAEIDAVDTPASLLAEVARLHVRGRNVSFNFGPDVDPHDAVHYVTRIDAGGLGLPDRDFYTNTDPASDSLRSAYLVHVSNILVLGGERPDAAKRDAARVMWIETELAKASLAREARRDPAAINHQVTFAQFQAAAPAIDWKAYFRDVGLTVAVRTVNVSEPRFLTRLNEMTTQVPLTDWRAYLRYHVLSESAPWLTTAFANEAFAFDSRLTGAQEQLPRWKRCLQVTDASVGEALGQAYVARTFPPSARARAKAVIDDIRASFAKRVAAIDWMSPATKRRALTKLAMVREKIGYPDTWRDYSKLLVDDGPFVLNVRHANEFEWQRTINRPGAKVDLSEWRMTVPTVNASYDATKNDMEFPSGALAPQTFDPKADDAANYGSLGGSWAGHELTHGFDDEGRHFDGQGNLRDWWAPSDSAHFTGEAQKVVDQFNGYVQVDTLHVNGRLTLGENIADFGGLLTAYDALQRGLGRDGRPGLIDGFTPEQRFFLGYAQSWRSHSRPETLRTRITMDPHAPSMWRTNGPLSNMPAFAAAFGCKPGDPMVRSPALVPHIW